MGDELPTEADLWECMAYPLWRFSRGGELEDAVYAWFNVAEAVAWWAIAVWVGVRWVRYRRSRLEPLYVLLFIVFGLSDWLESHHVNGWLIVTKGLIFANLVTLRVYLVHVWYPGWRF